MYAIWRKYMNKYLRNPKNKKQIMVFETVKAAKDYINKTYKKTEYFQVVPIGGRK